MDTNGTVTNGAAGDIVTNPQMSASDVMAQTLNGNTRQNQQGVQQTSQPDNKQPENQQAFFQSEWDKFSNTFREYGIDLKPGIDYKSVIDPYFQSHNKLKMLDDNPELILDIARELFPDRITEPDYATIVKSQLEKEFGKDFIFNKEEADDIGSPSWKYRLRQNSIIQEIQRKQDMEKFVQEREALERQNIAKQAFAEQYKLAREELNLSDEQLGQYLQKMNDSKYWNLSNIIKIMMLADGALEYVPPEEPGQGYQGPTSPGNISGNEQTFDKDLLEFGFPIRR